MAARAIWKGTLCIRRVEVPVKLYSAVEDRNVRFRLLHRKDKSPVRQALVNPDTGNIVAYNQTRRMYRTDEGSSIFFDQEELEDLRPEPCRRIDILEFLPERAIDHRWYDRPYYLGPDGADAAWAALIAELAHSGREGLAHWVMRKKEYYGALRLYEGYPMLMSLRYQDEVVAASELEAPKGKALDKKELAMARQLIGMLDAEFEPESYQDEYRGRVLELIDKKRKGGRVRRKAPARRKPVDNVAAALEASLKEQKHGTKKAAKSRK